ncbi:hypothetical protein ACFWNT_31900 [Streptomyces sp. NPDC058409]|uniref:hypothetical protein n=1 Tax=Streptomyces sp. NPDC058409 TaxID=3346484 RepID=UPI003647D4F7
MTAATDEKAQILDHLAPGTVVDVGAGGGELAARIAEHPGIDQVWALDNALDSIQRLSRIPSIDTVHGMDRLAEIGPGPPGDERLAYERAVAHAIDALAPWGQLVIRDFVTPATSREHVDVVVLTSEDGALFAEYLPLTTFLENTLIVGLNDVYRLFRGRANAIAAALLTLSWGAEPLPQESKERYCLASL